MSLADHLRLEGVREGGAHDDAPRSKPTKEAEAKGTENGARLPRSSYNRRQQVRTGIRQVGPHRVVRDKQPEVDEDGDRMGGVIEKAPPVDKIRVATCKLLVQTIPRLVHRTEARGSPTRQKLRK